MRATLVPLPHFLHAAIRACEYAESKYPGMAIVLDRRAERRSRLLDELASEGSSINDVTRRDLLIAIPGNEALSPSLMDWVLDPHRTWDAVGAPGLRMAAPDLDRAWAEKLWDLLLGEVERVDSAEDQERILKAVDSSASAVCDYLGLNEGLIPCLVVFVFSDRKVFIFQYGGDADNTPYQFFKEIAQRRPQNSRTQNWLADAVTQVASQWGLREGKAPALAPALAGWKATVFLPPDVNELI